MCEGVRQHTWRPSDVACLLSMRIQVFLLAWQALHALSYPFRIQSRFKNILLNLFVTILGSIWDRFRHKIIFH